MHWALVLVALVTRSVVARRAGSLPLGADETHRRPSKSAECQLGGEVRELGSTWFADLGPPFGIMYCIKCQCVPVQKKRKIIGKVHCRNIKNECPKPTCDEPVLYPGKCCKVCPDDVDNPDIPQDLDVQPSEEDEKNMKYFASVLTGDGTATGRFSFHKRSLYFSFYATSRPTSIQFLDPNGNIIEEQELGPGTVYQNATEKICGVWRRVPRDYRKLIRKEQLTATLIWADKKKNISGQIYRYHSLQTEMFSALLSGDGYGSGGTAIVSVSTTPPSVHITAVFAGTIFSKEDAVDAPVTVRLLTADGETIVFDEIVKVPKASPDLNTLEISLAVSGSELRLLSRNKLRLVITSRSSGRAIDGLVRPRAVCETFQALMKPGEGEEGASESAGLAWLFVDRSGRLDFHVRIDRVTRPVIIGLVTERRLVELEDLSPELTSNGWTNGSLEAPAPKYLEMLYAGELGVNVATQSSKSVIKGRLTGKYVASPIDSAAPLLLTNEGIPRSSDNTQLSALAWIDFDMECNLHYEVELTKEGDYSLNLLQVPLDLPGAPETRHFLASGSNHIEGSALQLLPRDLDMLHSGVVKLEVKHSSGNLLIRALWPNVNVPESCLPNYNSHYHNGGSQRNDLDPGIVLDDPVMPFIPPTPGPCLHEGSYHEEGSQWRSTTDPCTICHCLIGQLTCEPLVCPALPSSCHKHVPKGQCCPVCQNETTVEEKEDENAGCQMAGQHFHPGSTWHPYLPPHGFDVCTTCTCHSHDLRVTCSRTTCPPLNCDERVAVKPDKKSCCKVCPSSLIDSNAPAQPPRDIQGEEGATESPEQINQEILAQGGCKYPVGGPYHNGQQWHPRLYSHGEIKCVKCRCKDGKVKCERKRCTKWSCNDECCMAQCKRRRRNIRRHH